MPLKVNKADKVVFYKGQTLALEIYAYTDLSFYPMQLAGFTATLWYKDSSGQPQSTPLTVTASTQGLMATTLNETQTNSFSAGSNSIEVVIEKAGTTIVIEGIESFIVKEPFIAVS